jgi:hypothetical protein
MAEAEIVDYPVAGLPDRYGKARSAIYTQMDKLGIAPYKQGNKAFISNHQLRLLDRLNDFLNEDASRNIDDFIRERNVTKPKQRQSQPTGQLTRQDAGLSSELSFLPLDNTQVVTNKIANLRERFQLLDEAAAKGWLLSTSDLAGLCEVLPDSLTKRSQFQRWGFTFIKRPVRSGQEVSWEVQAPRRQK